MAEPSPLERRLVEAIDPARLEAELRAVVAIPSITGDEGPIQDLVARLVEEAGLELERVETHPDELARTRTIAPARQ